MDEAALPAVMQAAVYRGPGRVEVERLPIPTPGVGELLIRVHACGVCGTDLKKIALGLVAPPRVFGHETAGVIAATGPGETEWSVGDRVVVHHHVPCRRSDCYYCRYRSYANCPTYRATGVTAGFEPAGGGFAEYALVLPFVRPGIVRIPDGVSYEAATLLEPLNTVLKGARIAQVQAGETALVIGQGPIGLLFTQVLRREGVSVLGSDPLPGRRSVAAALGAVSVDPAGGVVDACLAATEGRGVDLAVVAVASTQVIPDAFAAVRPGGRVLLFAQTRLGDPVEVDAGLVCMREKALLGSYSADIDLQPECARMIFDREIDVAPLITHRFPLGSISEALHVASHPTDGGLKVLVTP